MKEEYLGIFVYVCFATFLALLIVVLSYFLVTQSPETEKLSTYECGFEPTVILEISLIFDSILSQSCSSYSILRLFSCYHGVFRFRN